jgi:hypothetical protein
MPQGYLSFMLWCNSAILLACGWKDTVLHSIASRAVVLFYAGWACSYPLSFWLDNPRITPQFGVVLAAGASLILFAPSLAERIYLFSAAALLASLYLLVTQLYARDPVLILYSAKADPVIIVSAVTLLLFKRSKEQICAISLGMAAGDASSALIPVPGAEPVIGSALWCDQWWLAVTVVCLATLICNQLNRGIRKFAPHIDTRLKGWKR